MNHSFSKLETLLSTYGLIPKTLFTIDSYIVYIEIFSLSNSSTFLLYIPSKFNIKAEKGDIYKLKYIDLETPENIVQKYAEDPDNNDIKNDYDEVNIEEQKTEDLENSLNENYNREIMLKDINKDDKDILKDIFRQLNRFKFCVQNIKYKITILYKNYLCSIKRDDTIECYYIKNFPTKKGRCFYISTDLKSMYESIKSVVNDVKTVKESIYKILNQNQLKHSKILINMLENKEKLLSYSDLIYKKKEYFEKYIEELEGILIKLKENQNCLLEEKKTIRQKENYDGIKGVHVDIQNSHLVFNIDTKLTKIDELIQELNDDILKTRLDRENLTLQIDKILFDNSIMLNEIIKNFNSITQIIE
jgi:hypothetical protein